MSKGDKAGEAFDQWYTKDRRTRWAHGQWSEESEHAPPTKPGQRRGGRRMRSCAKLKPRRSSTQAMQMAARATHDAKLCATFSPQRFAEGVVRMDWTEIRDLNEERPDKIEQEHVRQLCEELHAALEST